MPRKQKLRPRPTFTLPLRWMFTMIPSGAEWKRSVDVQVRQEAVVEGGVVRALIRLLVRENVPGDDPGAQPADRERAVGAHRHLVPEAERVAAVEPIAERVLAGVRSVVGITGRS
jgi:hypothetical protein